MKTPKKWYIVSFTLSDDCKPEPLTKKELKDVIKSIDLPAGVKLTDLEIKEDKL